MDKETLLSCRDVSLGYEGHTVWEHLTFSVHSGEYLCIVGENGSGKSTLLKSLLGLLPPLKGVIRRSEAAGAVGYLPQQTQAQRDFPATVSEVVLSGFLSARGPAAAQDLYRTLAYLNKNEGLAIVMVTHDLQSALQYADTVLYAGQGKWFHGTTAEYLASPYGRRFGGERT